MKLGRINSLNMVLTGMLLPGMVLLASCGGGGGGGTVADGGIGGTGVVASGSVTATGSIFVNGVEYRVQDATFEREDETPETLNEVQDRVVEGMVVEVEGAPDDGGQTGQASEIHYEDIVEGPITAELAATGNTRTLSILGQTVILEQGVTRAGDGTPLDISLPAINDEVEISGFRDASATNGAIRATYVDDRTATALYEIEGRVENLSVGGTSFQVAGLTVDYSGVPAVSNGQLVEIKGTPANYNSVSDTLAASSVEVRTAGLDRTNVARAEVEALVTNLDTGNQTFELDGQLVDYAAAVFEGGASGDLGNGSFVEAEGSLNANGVLVATKVSFRDNIRFEGNAISVTGSGLNGQFQIQGLNHATGPDIVILFSEGITEFRGIADVTELQTTTNNHVRVRARLTGAGDTLMATRLEDRGGEDSNLTVRGPLTSADFVGETSINLIGDAKDPTDPLTINIDTPPSDPPSGMLYLAEDEVTILTRSQFYGSLSIGREVKANGIINETITSPTPDWTELQLE